MWPPKENILKVDLPRENGRGWKRTSVEIDAQDPALGAGWRERAASGAKYVIQETWVKANDPHFDAKARAAGLIHHQQHLQSLVALSRSLPPPVDTRSPDYGGMCITDPARYFLDCIHMEQAASSRNPAAGHSKATRVTAPEESRVCFGAPQFGLSGFLTDGCLERAMTFCSSPLGTCLHCSLNGNPQERFVQFEQSKATAREVCECAGRPRWFHSKFWDGRAREHP